MQLGNQLKEFVQNGSQEAFKEIVQIHLPLVWSTARRQVQDSHLAEDVAQQVFALLAQKARTLSDDVILSGWLYQATVHTASKVQRQEHRRTTREQQAANLMSDSTQESAWSQIEPLLDSAMSELDERDRDAIVLRYFEKKSLKDVGAALGINDDAAQKRLSRAVEKLRQYFAQHSQAVSATTLIAGLGVGAIQPAPAALLASITSTAVSSLPAASNLTLISWTMIKPVAATIAIVGLAATAVVQRNTNQSLRAELDETRTALAELNQTPPTNNSPHPPKLADESELLRLRAEVARLRTAATELDQTKADFASFREAAERAWQQTRQNQSPIISVASSNITRTVRYLQQAGLGLRMIAESKSDTEFFVDGKATPEFVKAFGNEAAVRKVFENVTLLVNNASEINRLVSEQPDTVVGYSTKATQDDEGRWVRSYLTADGSVTRLRHTSAEEIWEAAKR